MCVWGGIKQSIMLSASLKSCAIFLFSDSQLRFLWQGCSRHPDRSDATPRAASAAPVPGAVSEAWLHPTAVPEPPLTPGQRAGGWGDISAANLLCSPLIAQGKAGAFSSRPPARPVHPCTAPAAAALRRSPGPTCHGRELCANENYSGGKPSNGGSLLGWSGQTSLCARASERRRAKQAVPL